MVAKSSVCILIITTNYKNSAFNLQDHWFLREAWDPPLWNPLNSKNFPCRHPHPRNPGPRAKPGYPACIIYMVILCFLRNVSLQKLWRGKGSWRNILVGRNLVIAACSECNTVAKVISSLDANFAAFVMTIVTNYKFTFAGESECCSALRNSILRQKSRREVLGFCIISSLEYGLELRNC